MGVLSHYLKNKLHDRSVFSGSYLCTDLMALENFIVNPPKTASAKTQFTALKRQHRAHYKALSEELQSAA